MKTETAKETLKKNGIIPLDDKVERKIIEAMIEYAKAKVNERDNLLQEYANKIDREIQTRIIIEKAKTPDFK